MGIIKLIGQFLKIIGFFLDLWKEKDKFRAEQKAAAAKEVVDAFKITDKDDRASAVSAAIARIGRLRH